MRDLLILGTGAHAMEMAEIVDRINKVERAWNLVGFVAPWAEQAGEERLGLPVFGPEQVMERYPTAFVVPEYDWPHKAQISRQRLATLIDPGAFVSPTAQLGLGCVVYPQCFIGAYARIGDLLFCLAGSVINHEDVIEDRVTLTSAVTIAGNVHVEADCYLGQSCTIREMVRIGRGSLIGMGSTVLRDVAPNSVMIGSPARKLGARHHRVFDANISKVARRFVRKVVRTIRRKARGAQARVMRKVVL